MLYRVAPSQGRGLKRFLPQTPVQRGGRPFTGAWIETDKGYPTTGLYNVAPSQGRGLKRQKRKPSLKPHRRPFTGAWIETLENSMDLNILSSRPFTGAWIETNSQS